jgi:hypothetical protein
MLVGFVPLAYLAKVARNIPEWLGTAGVFYFPVAILVTVTGAVFGFIGLLRKQRRKGFAWLDLLLGCASLLWIALILVVVVIFAFITPRPA